MDYSNPQTIKALSTKQFEIELAELNGLYFIVYQRSNETSGTKSEGLLDYKTASMLFDMKVQELEGQ